MLPVQAVDAVSKPAPQPVADGHSRPAAARAHGVHRGHARHGRSENITRNSEGGRPNDIQVTADDGGGAPQHASGAHGTKARPSRGGNASRPGTGADTGFSSDADDPALPPEAQEALQEAADLQHSGHGQQQAPQPAPAQGAPQQGGQVGAPPNAGAPRATTPRQGIPRQPTTPRRPDQQSTDQSTNQTSNRRTAKMPVAFFNGGPSLGASRLVLHYNAGGVSPERTVTLQCYPSGGTHPKAAEACADVTKASGDLAQVPAQRNARACFMIYAPVTVSAQGEWNGQPVQFQEQYPNTCVMRDKTGSVFDF
jgi:hypothetical protein